MKKLILAAAFAATLSLCAMNDSSVNSNLELLIPKGQTSDSSSFITVDMGTKIDPINFELQETRKFHTRTLATQIAGVLIATTGYGIAFVAESTEVKVIGGALTFAPPLIGSLNKTYELYCHNEAIKRYQQRKADENV